MWKSLTEFFAKLAGLFASGSVAYAFEEALRYAKAALPIIELIAKATPNQTDDEIVALFREHAIPDVGKWLALPPDQRWAALLFAARWLFRKRFPNASGSTINAAINPAYLAWTIDQKAKQIA